VRWDKEPKHLRTLLNRRNAALGASVASQGLSYARVHAGSTLTPEGALDNLTGGLPHVNLVQGLVRGP
jgi:Zn-dependent M16 (insulinase) family peptidase